mgnify:CR=1 FL=1
MSTALLRRSLPVATGLLAAAALAAGACASGVAIPRRGGRRPEGGGAPEESAATARRARLDEVMQSTFCATCHPAIYAEHMVNTHGRAFIDPEARLATRDFRRENCVRCHTPRPMFETGLGMTPIERHHDLEEGNTCMSCHWKAGYDYAAFSGGAECRTAFDERAGDVAACSTCHRVAATPEQWSHAPLGAQAGRECVDCHMPLVKRPVAVGQPARLVRSHEFPGSRSESQVRRAYGYEVEVDGSDVVVRITNKGAGHDFNTATRQRAIESLVVVRDAAGREITNDRKIFKAPYGDATSLDMPVSTQIPSGATREHRVHLDAPAGTVTCHLLFKLYYPVEDGHPTLARDLEQRVLHFSGVDPKAPSKAPAVAAPAQRAAVPPAEAARPDSLVKFAHPASGTAYVPIPTGDSDDDIEHLVAILEFPVPGARVVARRRLLEIGARTIPFLVNGLGHWSDETFDESMELLVQIGPQTAPALSAALADERLYVRYHARMVLTRLGFPGDRDALRSSLVAALDAENALDRRSAADALGHFGDASVAPTLRALLDDPDWDVVASAARALGRLGDDDAIEPIERTLAHATFVETRRDLALALADLDSAAGVPALLAGLDHPDDVLRRSFFDAFFAVTGRHMAYDPDAPRPERLEALARLQSWWAEEGGAEALVHREEPAERAQEAAWRRVQALGGGTDVLPGGDDTALMHELVAAGSDAVPALIDGLTFPSGFTVKRALVCEALGRIGDPQATPYLVRVLRDPDLTVAAWACWALARTADDAALPALRSYQQRVDAYALRAPHGAEGDAPDRLRALAAETRLTLGDDSARVLLANLDPPVDPTMSIEPAHLGGVVTRFEGATQAPPASPADAIERAQALRRQDWYEDAVALLQVAEERFGASAALRLELAWNVLMITEEDMTRDVDPAQIETGVAEARWRFEQAIAMDPAVPGRELLEAKILRHEGRGDEARPVLEEYLVRSPRDVFAHTELGDLASEQRDFATADREYSIVASILPSDGWAVLYATEARQWLGRPVAELEQGYVRAAALLPGQVTPLRLLARLHPNDPDRTLALLEQVVRDRPDGAWARIWQAYVLRTRAEPDLARAEHVLREALVAGTDDRAVHFNLGQVLEEERRPGDAVKEYVAALESSQPGDVAETAEALDRLLCADDVRTALPADVRTHAWDVLLARTPGTERYVDDAKKAGAR